MQVRRWGSNLAIELPDDLVRDLDLKEGDQLELESLDGQWLLSHDTRRRAAIEKLQSLAVDPPPGFRFSRDDAYERDGG